MYFTKRFYSIEIVQIHCIHCLALMACPAFVRSSLHVVPRVEAQRTVLAGIVRMCVVTGLALVTLLLMTTKPGTVGPMWPLMSAHRSREMAQGSVGNSVQCGHCQPASLSASLSNVNSECVSFETNPTPALEKI